MITRIERMLGAAERLPADMNSLFHDLFSSDKTEAQVCCERNITMNQLKEMRTSMLRNLRAAIS